MSRRPWWLLPPGRIPPSWWIAVGVAILLADRFVAPALHFPVIYAIPVVLAAWYSGTWPALMLALAVPLVRIAFMAWPANAAGDSSTDAIATAFRGAVVLFLGLWFARLAEFERTLDRRVNILEGMLPICAFCKNIQNEGGEWERLEVFISKRSEAEFSHGLCPSCGEIHYPGVLTKR